MAGACGSFQSSPVVFSMKCLKNQRQVSERQQDEKEQLAVLSISESMQRLMPTWKEKIRLCLFLKPGV
jgi:hypothetical protein